MSESKLQITFINWMRSALPDVLVWHSYQENAINAIQGKIKKDRGVLAGVHDNCLVFGEGKFATIELKDPDKPKSANKYSDPQKAFAERLDKLGIRHFCCQNGEQIEAAIISLGLIPRWPFPRSLDASKRQMLQMDVMDAMYK